MRPDHVPGCACADCMDAFRAAILDLDLDPDEIVSVDDTPTWTDPTPTLGRWHPVPFGAGWRTAP